MKIFSIAFVILSRGEENKKQRRSNSVRGLLPEPRSIGIVEEKERHRSCSRCSPDARGEARPWPLDTIPAMRNYWHKDGDSLAAGLE